MTITSCSGKGPAIITISIMKEVVNRDFYSLWQIIPSVEKKMIPSIFSDWCHSAKVSSPKWWGFLKSMLSFPLLLYWDNVLNLERKRALRKNRIWNWIVSVRYLKQVFFNFTMNITMGNLHNLLKLLSQVTIMMNEICV